MQYVWVFSKGLLGFIQGVSTIAHFRFPNAQRRPMSQRVVLDMGCMKVLEAGSTKRSSTVTVKARRITNVIVPYS